MHWIFQEELTGLFNVRVVNRCWNWHIDNIGKLVTKTPEELLEIPGIGRKSVWSIEYDLRWIVNAYAADKNIADLLKLPPSDRIEDQIRLLNNWQDQGLRLGMTKREVRSWQPPLWPWPEAQRETT